MGRFQPVILNHTTDTSEGFRGNSAKYELVA